ncbi:MAG: ParB/Srx family N-terminal domain-containing protein [Anaerolineales bacterium]
MAQLQVNLEGSPVAIENRKVSLNTLLLDESNPRIGLYKDSQLRSALSSEEIRHAIINRSPEAYAKLRDSIEINQGIINPIWISPMRDGMYLVIEGNTRVLIYRELSDKYPSSDIWKSIPANVLPVGIQESQINFIRLEAHLRGVTEWDAYERARYLYILNEKEGYSVRRLEQLTRLKGEEIETEIRAFRDMSDVYNNKYPEDPYQSQKFSYFVEYERSNRIKQEMLNSSLTVSDFCDWVGTGRIPRAENVRRLTDILENKTATSYFLADGYENALSFLALAQPDLVSPLFQRIDDVVERLRRLPFYEVEQIRNGKQPGRKRLLNELAQTAQQVWKRVSEDEEDIIDEAENEKDE